MVEVPVLNQKLHLTGLFDVLDHRTHFFEKRLVDFFITTRSASTHSGNGGDFAAFIGSTIGVGKAFSSLGKSSFVVVSEDNFLILIIRTLNKTFGISPAKLTCLFYEEVEVGAIFIFVFAAS